MQGLGRPECLVTDQLPLAALQASYSEGRVHFPDFARPYSKPAMDRR